MSLIDSRLSITGRFSSVRLFGCSVNSCLVPITFLNCMFDYYITRLATPSDIVSWHHTYSVEHDDSVWQFSRLSNELLPRRRITRFIMVLNHNEFRGGHLLFSFCVSLQASFSQSKNSNCRSTNVIFIFLVAHIYDNNRR